MTADEPVDKPEGPATTPPPVAPASLRDQVRPALLAVPVLTLLTGVLYPLVLAAAARRRHTIIASQ